MAYQELSVPWDTLKSIESAFSLGFYFLEITAPSIFEPKYTIVTAFPESQIVAVATIGDADVTDKTDWETTYKAGAFLANGQDDAIVQALIAAATVTSGINSVNARLHDANGVKIVYSDVGGVKTVPVDILQGGSSPSSLGGFSAPRDPAAWIKLHVDTLAPSSNAEEALLTHPVGAGKIFVLVHASVCRRDGDSLKDARYYLKDGSGNKFAECWYENPSSGSEGGVPEKAVYVFEPPKCIPIGTAGQTVGLYINRDSSSNSDKLIANFIGFEVDA